MKAAEVLKLLKISRPTLLNYIKQGLIKATKQLNGRYDYDEDSIYALIGEGARRKNIIYIRNSLEINKDELEKKIIAYCYDNDILFTIESDDAEEYSLKRTGLINLTKFVARKKVDKIFILNKEQIGRPFFNFFRDLFLEFDSEIIILEEESNWNNFTKEYEIKNEKK